MRAVLRMVAFLLCSAGAARAQTLQLATYDYPPYMQAAASPAKPGDRPGPVVEVVQEAFRRAGIETAITFYPFQRAKRLLEIGGVGGLFTLKMNAERAQRFVFSKEPLLRQEYVVYVPHDSPLVFGGDLNQLRNVTMGLVEATSYGNRFDEFANTVAPARKDYSNSHEANFRKLIAGRVQLIVCSRAVGDALLKRTGAARKVKVIGPPIEVASSYMMFNPAVARPAAIARFDIQLRAMRKDGTLQRIYARYPD